MNKIKLKIIGKNIERFIKRLKSFNIELLKIEYIKYNEINIIINKKDYEKIIELKTIYEINIIELYGIDKIKNIIKTYKYIIISIIISFIFILFLSKIIFKVEIIHNDKEIRNILTEELSNYNIKPLGFIKNYKYITKVKKNILEKYKDKIEWLEIEKKGTKYLVRVEERKIKEKNKVEKPRNIIAKKDAIIMNINAKNGEIKKNKLDYVRKGDIIVSGSITLNEEIKNNIVADAKIFGEVWYKATVEYPLNYKEEKILSKEKNIYFFKINNFEFKLNNIKDYNVISKEETILKHNFLPISLIKKTSKKVEYINELLTKDEAIEKALKYAEEKMKSKLNEKEYIIDTKKLKVEENNSKIILEVFFSVYEDITDYQLIEGE